MLFTKSPVPSGPRLLEQQIFVAFWLLLGLFLLLAWTLGVATPKTERAVYSDLSTHVMIASSVWGDGDLIYTLEDLRRFRDDYPASVGPSGLFLKQASDGALYFAKPYIYGVVAAPFYGLGGINGFIVLNVLCLLAIGLIAGLALNMRLGRYWALFASVGFVLPSAFLPWVFVPHPDLFIAALLAVGSFLLLRDMNTRVWQVLGAAILGAALHEKIPFIFALPFIVAAVPSNSWRWRGVLGALIAVFWLLFSMPNIVIDDSLFTYQGLRLYASGNPFPLEAGWTPVNSGITSHIFDPVALVFAIINNLGLIWTKLLDFLVGRQTGIIPYFAVGFALLMIRPFFGPSRSALVLVGLFSYLVVQWLVFPTNGYGGAGSYGSRYLMQALPLIPIAYLNLSRLQIGSNGLFLERFSKGFLIIAAVFALVIQHRVFFQGNKLVELYFTANTERPINAFRLEKWLITSTFERQSNRYTDEKNGGSFRVISLDETEQDSWLQWKKNSNKSTFVLYKYDSSVTFPTVQVISPIDTQGTIEIDGQIIWSGKLLGGQPTQVKVDNPTSFQTAFDLLLNREIGLANLKLNVDHVARYSDGKVRRPLLRFSTKLMRFETFGKQLRVKDLVASGVELRNGWSQLEPWGVWSDGSQADIVLRVGQGELFNAELLTHAYIPPRRKTLEAKFRCNGLLTQRVLYLPEQLQTIRIPCRKRAEDDYIVIGVDVVDPTSPLAEGRGKDSRLLGVGLHSVKIDRTNKKRINR
jgi:hypothetical protein